MNNKINAAKRRDQSLGHFNAHVNVLISNIRGLVFNPDHLTDAEILDAIIELQQDLQYTQAQLFHAIKYLGQARAYSKHAIIENI